METETDYWRQKPTIGDRNPSIGDRNPSIGGRNPSIGDKNPSIGDRNPSIGGRNPSIGGRNPSIGGRNPSIGDKNPSIGDRNSSIGDRNPSIYNEKLDFEIYSQIVGEKNYHKRTIESMNIVYYEISSNQIFGAPEIQKILNCTLTSSKDIMQKLREMKLVVPVMGYGKGKYRFCYNEEIWRNG